MSIENRGPQPESNEVKRNKILAKVNAAVKRFIVAGLVLEASFGVSITMPGDRTSGSLKAKNEIARNADESRKLLQEIKTQKDTVLSDADRQKVEEEFDYDFQFEHEQLTHFKDTEAKLRDVFGSMAPTEAQRFMEDLSAARSSAGNLSKEDRSKWKILFEEKFFPRVVEEESHPQLGAVETAEGRIDPETLRIMLATFPRNWVNGEVSSISQTDKAEVKERGGVQWTTDADFRYQDEKVTLYGNIKTHSPTFFADVLAHESGHANDWKGNKRANYEDKLNLLLQVLARLDAGDRFKSEYAESKLKDSEDPKLNKYLYAQEYWADICAQYFRDPIKLSVNDFEIVDGWVKKSDPKYNPMALSEQRMQILNEISKK